MFTIVICDITKNTKVIQTVKMTSLTPTKVCTSLRCEAGVDCIGGSLGTDKKIRGANVIHNRQREGHTYCSDECQFAFHHRSPLPLKGGAEFTASFADAISSRYTVWIDVEEKGVSEQILAICDRMKKEMDKCSERPSLALVLCWPAVEEGEYEAKVIVLPSGLRSVPSLYEGLGTRLEALFPKMREEKRKSGVKGAMGIRWVVCERERDCCTHKIAITRHTYVVQEHRILSCGEDTQCTSVHLLPPPRPVEGVCE